MRANETIIDATRDDFSSHVKFFQEWALFNERFDVAMTMKNLYSLTVFIERVFSSPMIGEVFLYFCMYGAATCFVVQNELHVPEASAYRALKRLRSLNLIEPALKVSLRKGSKGGPRPVVWALQDTSTENVARALRLHESMLSPKFRLASEAAQTIIKDYLIKRNVEEISFREIVIQVKELKTPFKTGDIAELTADYIQEKGFKVWR